MKISFRYVCAIEVSVEVPEDTDIDNLPDEIFAAADELMDRQAKDWDLVDFYEAEDEITAS